jgi:putative CocE/NonD family hydrolase
MGRKGGIHADAAGSGGGNVRRIDHTWIPLSDGTRLAARIWLPEPLDAGPVPALLEAIPYRKNDVTASGDAGRHAYFAAHGYASVRVDIRGSGDSDGVLADEYTAQEQRDALEVIAWLAAQPWCTGRVGMFGVSWGGFAALQVAALRPPELCAIVTVSSSDDRYADDVHYMGGCVLAYYMLSWATTMHLFGTLPPDPEVVGPEWRERWLERLRGSRPMIEAWLGHQRRDAYWKHGSVCEDYAAVACPVFTVGGWADGYRNTVFRLLEHLSCPRLGLIGPWSHHYPEEPVPPGPAIGFLQECLRWWDHWLKGRDTGIMDEPQLRAWMQDPVEPRPAYDERPGRWVGEPAWPSPNVSVGSWALTASGGLGGDDRRTAALTVRSPQSHGLHAGDWDPFGNPADLPPDQRAEDGKSLIFTSEPLERPLAILGRPRVVLEIASDVPQALVVVRLCDIDESGGSALITRGLLNLSHRHSHEHPEPLEPGVTERVAVDLKAMGQVVPAGHRLRVAVAGTYWPWAWPSPEQATLTLHVGGAAVLELPVRGADDTDAAPAGFGGPEHAPRPAAATLHLEPGNHVITEDVGGGRHQLVHAYPTHHTLDLESGIEIRWREPDTFTVVEGAPLSAQVRCERSVSLGRGAWSVRLEAEATMAADADAFHVTHELRAYAGDEPAYSEAWSFRLPRDGV